MIVSLGHFLHRHSVSVGKPHYGIARMSGPTCAELASNDRLFTPAARVVGWLPLPRLWIASLCGRVFATVRGVSYCRSSSRDRR